MKSNFTTNLKGFTLIEVLTVVAIIGTLASIVMVSLALARAKARDTQRLSDVENIQAAVEQYYRDNGHYPITGATYASFDAPLYKCNPILPAPSASNIAAALQSYLPIAPTDPSRITGLCGASDDRGYLYMSATGASYAILVLHTPENMTDIPTQRIDMTRCLSISAGQCSGVNNICYNSSGGGC